MHWDILCENGIASVLCFRLKSTGLVPTTQRKEFLETTWHEQMFPTFELPSATRLSLRNFRLFFTQPRISKTYKLITRPPVAQHNLCCFSHSYQWLLGLCVRCH